MAKKPATKPTKKQAAPKIRRSSADDALTRQQELFVAEYLKDLNATQAAIRAGYSPRTANEQAARLLVNVSIQREIQRHMDARLHRIEESADSVLKRLIEEANADQKDLFNEDGSPKPIHEWPAIWRRGLVSGMEVEELFETDEDGNRKHIGYTKKLKFSERIKRVELIGRHIKIGAFRDRKQIEADGALTEFFNQIAGQGIRPKDQ